MCQTPTDEFADRGAEEGAGAALTVEEPWQGYARMNARQVIERLADASDAELAVIQLYESTHRGRRTLISAVERRLTHPPRPTGASNE
jgi:hypothetical protein